MTLTETSTTTAVLAHAAGDLRVAQLPAPRPDAHEALVEIVYGGICGSDLSYWRHGAVGESILREPMVLGHEVSGVVLAAAADGSGPAAGTGVVVHPARIEDVPERFPADRPNLSPGVRYLGSAARFPHTAGAFQRRIAVPAAMLRVVPPSVSLQTAALAEPASVAWHAVERAGDVRGRSVLVVGSGPIGALIVGVLRRAGAAHITVVDVLENPLAIAQLVGADRTLLAGESAAIAATDADIAIESSGNPRGLASALSGTTRGGRVVMVGLPPTGDQPVPLSLAITREIDLVGSFRFLDPIDEVLAAFADSSLGIDPVITHVFPVEQSEEAFRIAGDASVSGKVLLDFGAPTTTPLEVTR
ncbi:L-idonate 5-dehydrogenase [Rathayibacter sp. SD072]|uniref:L-idonate 5-dehydrogenase n=1 Tax=Rathayibacter sp. SD072 TaxID=2781731 RepID=UPI001A957FBA|nr:L-idonate 5-dehydrogenase [Rathayibacter sp. SD072]MBO0982641.1 L-idonate 5-dehydrogenase [Rathayibacter sp. SD072]